MTASTQVVGIGSENLSAITLRKISWRLIPFLFVLYILAWLDRVNVSFAALQMNSDLGFSPTAFGFGSGIFFLGYCLFEVPSNLILERVGARLWIARIMITWGVISAGMMFVREPISFCILRFLLGAAEAGFFPGVVYYLSLWYPGAQRGQAIAAFMVAIPVTGVVGGLLSGALLGLDGFWGLHGWQWLFLVEGLPAIFLGAVTLIYLNDGPETVRWLTPAEKDWLVTKLTVEREACKASHSTSPMSALTNRTIWQLGIIFFFSAIGFFGYTFWAPIVIKSLLGLTDFWVGVVSALISGVTIIGMLLNSAHSDRRNEQPLHIAIPLLIMALGFVGCALFRQPGLAVLSLALVPLGHCGAYGPFWSMPTRFLTGPAAASGVALVATIASVGGFLGPTIVGALKGRTGTHVLAFILLGGIGSFAALIALRLRHATAVKNPSLAESVGSGYS